MTKHEIDLSTTTLPRSKRDPEVPAWSFMQVDAVQRTAAEDSPFMRILKVGSSTALKVWQLHKPLRIGGAIVAAVALAGLAYLGWMFRDHALLTVEGVGLFVLTALVTIVFGKTVMKIVWFRKTLIDIGLGIGMALFGFLVARVHLHIFNKLYLRLGRMERL
jgi:hypothetical protein